MNLLLQLLANGLVNGALYAVLAIGFGLVWRSIGAFHIAFGGLYVLCGHMFYTFATSAGLPLWIAFAATVCGAALAGWIIELALYRPFHRRHATNGAVMIASLGVLVVLENLLAILYGDGLHVVPRGISKPWTLGTVVLAPIQLMEFTVGLVLVVVLWILLRRVRLLKALWAMGDQPELVSVLGLPLYLLRSMTLVISTVLAAVVASLTCLDIGTDPHVGMSYMLVAAVAVLVGGRNSVGGWVCGAFVLAILQSLVVWQFSARWMDLVTFALLVLMLAFRPRGLIERTKRMEESS